MIHSSYYRPNIFPINGDVDKANIDRLQELTATTTLNREKIKEIGRDGLVDWRKATPDISLSMRQLEYGSLEFYRKLTSKGDSVSTISFTDFKTPTFDIAGYKTDDAGTFTGTVYYPKCRCSGFTVNIGDPESLIDRNFTVVGEDEIILREANKYLITKRYTLSGGTDETVTVSDPAPVADPDNSGQYLFRVVKVVSGTATTLVHGTGWSYDGAGTLTINGVSTAGTVIKVWYSAGSYIGGEIPFTENDSDLAGIDAESCSVFLESSNYLYRLQSASFEVALDRYDIGEIGNKDKVAYGTRDITARVTLGRILEAYTIEEILRGQAGNDYGKIDVREFASNLNLIIKVYSDNTKDTFKIGYKITDLAPSGTDTGTPTDDYITRGVTLEGETGFITNVEGVL